MQYLLQTKHYDQSWADVCISRLSLSCALSLFHFRSSANGNVSIDIFCACTLYPSDLRSTQTDNAPSKTHTRIRSIEFYLIFLMNHSKHDIIPLTTTATQTIYGFNQVLCFLFMQTKLHGLQLVSLHFWPPPPLMLLLRLALGKQQITLSQRDFSSRKFHNNTFFSFSLPLWHLAKM